jgi:intracellular septation protein
MQRALAYLLGDYLSAIVFLAAYGASGRLRSAVGAAVLFGIVPILWRAWRYRRIEPLRWLNGALIVALGAAAWAAHTPRFVMARPSAVHFALAAAMSRGGWMFEYLNAPARDSVPRAVMVAAGYAWAVLMAALGFTNLIIALYFDVPTWAWFVAVISPGVKMAALALQFSVFRGFVRRRGGTAAAGDPENAE